MTEHDSDLMSEVEAELDTLQNAWMERVGDWARELAEVSAKVSVLEKRKKELKANIMQALDSAGLDAAVAGGRRLGFTTRTYWGVAEGATPTERAANVTKLQDWLDTIAPEVNVPASMNINKAVTAFIEEGGDPETLPFLSKSESRSLTNRKA